MAGLMIQGDPGGWSDVGGSLRALAARLETGVSDADSFGAQALARSWAGPAAAAFSAHWATRRPRYEDLIVLVRRAARAILAYAHTLEDMRARAVNLESVWCGVGLHVLYTGEGFMLPPGVESMPPHAQVSLRQALSDSARDVESLGADCVAAATDLAAVLVPVIALLEDFVLISVGAFLTSYRHEFVDDITDPLSLVSHVTDAAGRIFKDSADNAKSLASQLGYYLSKGTAGERSAAGQLLSPTAADAARYAAYAKVAGVVGLGVEAVDVILQVRTGARKSGWEASLESHGGDIAETAYSAAALGLLGGTAEGLAGSVLLDAAGGALLAAGAPEIVVGVGVAALGGAVAIGVGAGVQAIIDHRQAIGHFVESVL